MIDLTSLYDLIPLLLPFECLKLRFMQQAFLGILLLAPMAGAMGIQVVNFRMAFFSDAIGHSVFAGVAIGLIFSINPYWSTPLLGVLVGLAIMATQRSSLLSTDTIIGVFFSAIVAFGLAIISRDGGTAMRSLSGFIYGDILTISDENILLLMLLSTVLWLFQFFGYNRMIYIGLHPILAKVHRVHVASYQYLFAALLALVVIFSVWVVGVLLVTALLIVPAASARNFSRSAGATFWWTMLISVSSAIFGLIISAQDWAHTATGATIVLMSTGWFVVSLLIGKRTRRD